MPAEQILGVSLAHPELAVCRLHSVVRAAHIPDMSLATKQGSSACKAGGLGSRIP